MPLLSEGQAGELWEHSGKAGKRWTYNCFNFFAIFKELHNKVDNRNDDGRNKTVRDF
jgi:hypothetical protein